VFSEDVAHPEKVVGLKIICSDPAGNVGKQHGAVSELTWQHLGIGFQDLKKNITRM
jgi:hypothetical protein